MYSFLDQFILYYLVCYVQKYLKVQSKNRFLLICFGLKTLLFCLIKSINCVWAQGRYGFREHMKIPAIVKKFVHSRCIRILDH
jgi:hypothetical protein